MTVTASEELFAPVGPDVELVYREARRPEQFMNEDPVEAAPEDVAARSAGRHRWRLVLLLLVPLIGAGLALVIYLHGGRHVETDNAYVKADKVPVSAAVAGTVSEVLVGRAMIRARPKECTIP